VIAAAHARRAAARAQHRDAVDEALKYFVALDNPITLANGADACQYIVALRVWI